ncbi:MAG: aminotransferase class V-fold PLP-dependent enzyme [Clostridia bacterium]|nr:aminotransferase class V-fold PLP-dependent enzyme [Clostridia bacterium]
MAKIGEPFDSTLLDEIRDKFYYVNYDPDMGKRIFFENSGGSLRLKESVRVKSEYEQFPDCPERVHERALFLNEIQKRGTDDILNVICGAKSGALVTDLTASEINFDVLGCIAENVTGMNIVTTALEHPSAFDAAQYHCARTGKELRVAKANPKTGGVDAEEIIKLIDKDTCCVSVMSASNISGAVLDVEKIFKEAKKINPDIYCYTDAVQHVPHAAVDVEKIGADALVFAPYKFFGTRGTGFAYISDRLSVLHHRKLIAKSRNVWQLGSPTPSNFASLSAIVDYVCWIGSQFAEHKLTRREQFLLGMDKIRAHETALFDHMLNGTKEIQGLRSIPGVHVYFDDGDLAHKDLILAIAIDGIDYKECVKEYARRGVTVYERVTDSIYSKRMLDAFGLKGAIRISPIHCHSFEDVEEFLIITKKIAEMAARTE